MISVGLMGSSNFYIKLKKIGTETGTESVIVFGLAPIPDDALLWSIQLLATSLVFIFDICEFIH
jgi:hypothetical protein